MTQRELQERTLVFALAVFRFVRPLFRDADTRHIAQQLVRASSSAAANYRAACLARSSREWLAKLGSAASSALPAGQAETAKARLDSPIAHQNP
jgi:four helix bundle protein